MVPSSRSVPPDDDAPDAIREGLARRAIVNSGGTCPPPCGASWPRPSRASGVIRIDVEHEADCPATTEFLVSAIRAWEAGR